MLEGYGGLRALDVRGLCGSVDGRYLAWWSARQESKFPPCLSATCYRSKRPSLCILFVFLPSGREQTMTNQSQHKRVEIMQGNKDVDTSMGFFFRCRTLYHFRYKTYPDQMDKRRQQQRCQQQQFRRCWRAITSSLGTCVRCHVPPSLQCWWEVRRLGGGGVNR